MFSKATLLSLLPAALAAPAIMPASDYTGFGLIATHSTSPIHLQTINISGGGLMIGTDSSTYCPSGIQGLDCSHFSNSTQLDCAASDGSVTTCSPQVVVPGGQQLYVDPKSGWVSVTTPHSAYIPEGALQGGFKYTAQTKGAQEGLGNLGFCGGGAEGFVACPVEGKEHTWKVIVPLKGVDTTGCLSMSTVTSGSNATAWEYI
jgi:hypothetical protein